MGKSKLIPSEMLGKGGSEEHDLSKHSKVIKKDKLYDRLLRIYIGKIAKPLEFEKKHTLPDRIPAKKKAFSVEQAKPIQEFYRLLDQFLESGHALQRFFTIF